MLKLQIDDLIQGVTPGLTDLLNKGAKTGATVAAGGDSRSQRWSSGRPFSVSGISVLPVCCLLKLHSVSPCRMR